MVCWAEIELFRLLLFRALMFTIKLLPLFFLVRIKKKKKKISHFFPEPIKLWCFWNKFCYRYIFYNIIRFLKNTDIFEHTRNIKFKKQLCIDFITNENTIVYATEILSDLLCDLNCTNLQSCKIQDIWIHSFK